jgi:hypothetical protein
VAREVDRVADAQRLVQVALLLEVQDAMDEARRRRADRLREARVRDYAVTIAGQHYEPWQFTPHQVRYWEQRGFECSTALDGRHTQVKRVPIVRPERTRKSYKDRADNSVRRAVDRLKLAAYVRATGCSGSSSLSTAERWEQEAWDLVLGGWR